MFEQDGDEIFLQKDSLLNSQGRIYSLRSNNKNIGSIEETSESTKDMGNQLLKLISLYNVAGINLNVLDKKAKIVGVINKEKGFYKDFKLYSNEKKHLATVKPIVKIKSPTMTVVSPMGEELIKASGGYGATDFSVINWKYNELSSTIKKRSLVYHTIKDNLVNNDGYYIDNKNQDSLTILALLAMSIIVDVYFFNN